MTEAAVTSTNFQWQGYLGGYILRAFQRFRSHGLARRWPHAGLGSRRRGYGWIPYVNRLQRPQGGRAAHCQHPRRRQSPATTGVASWPTTRHGPARRLGPVLLYITSPAASQRAQYRSFCSSTVTTSSMARNALAYERGMSRVPMFRLADTTPAEGCKVAGLSQPSF